MGQKECKLERQILKDVHLDYLLHLPEDYDMKPEVKWPVILFLHGAGERGTNLDVVKRNGIPMIVEQDKDFPFIALSPQCPEYLVWTDVIDELLALIDDTLEHYNADPKRIYLTGLSMGGYGTWYLATLYPEKFAAIAPVCGGGFPEAAGALKKVPVWAFHGAKDDIVPPEESQKMVDALKECGGNVRFTLYPDANHNSWTPTYDNQELYSWFLQHSL